MKADRKARQQELASNIRRSQLPDAAAVKELLGLLIDDVKDSLVTAAPSSFAQLQGEAQAFKRLLAMVTKEPPSIAPNRGIDQ